MSENDGFKQSILEDIQKSGYPLEIEIYKILSKHQWNITPQYYYKDRITSTERSIDYICGKSNRGADEPYKKVIIRLAIECKNLNDKQWVLFSMEDTEVPFNEFTISNLQTLMREEKKAKFNKLKTGLVMDFISRSHYEKDGIPHAFSHYIPFGKKDSFHDAMQKSIGALKYSFDENQMAINKFDLDVFRNLYVFYPIIVCNKNLFEYKVDSDELIETDHIMYVTKGLGESYASYAIDVVTITGFEKLLQYLDQELISTA